MAKKIPPIVTLVKESNLEQKEGVKHISFSQLLEYHTCPHRWDIVYRQKLISSPPSIHLIFGTAMHEVIQSWLKVMYEESAKAAKELPLYHMLHVKLFELYKENKEKHGAHFSTADELQEFYLDGVQILDYLNSKRDSFFAIRGTHLAGIETLLYQEVRPGVYYKGYVDLVFYDEVNDIWKIIDIKTSTSGWSKYVKDDETKISQVLLYKEFFSKQFGVDVDKIEVEYFIIKRKVPLEADFPSMQRRVQQFQPPSGTMKRKKALSLISTFVEDTLDQEGSFIEKTYFANANTKSCRFCILRGTSHCSHGV